MKKILAIIIIIIGIIGVIIQCAICSNKIVEANVISEKDRLQAIKEKGVLTIVSPPKEVPFFYINPKTKEISGIDADIITEISKRLGIDKIEVKETVFSNLFEKLISDNNIDMAVGGIFIIPEKEQLLKFTKPLYRETETVIVPQFSDINYKNDLEKLVVGVERGTVFVDLAQNWKNSNIIKDIMMFESTTDLLNAINLRKVDAGIADSIIVNSILLNEGNKLPLRTLKGYTPELQENLGMAVRKDDILLLDSINKVIDEMKADGTLNAILVENGLNKENMIGA